MRKSDTKSSDNKGTLTRHARSLSTFIRKSFNARRAGPFFLFFIFSLSTVATILSGPIALATPSPDVSTAQCTAEKGTWQSDNSGGWCSVKPSDRNPKLKGQAWAVTNAFYRCVANSDGNLIDVTPVGQRITEEHMRAGVWFKDNTSVDVFRGAPDKVAASFLIDNVGDRGEVLCNATIKEVADLTGYGTDYRRMFCDVVPYKADGTSCTGNSGDFSGTGKQEGQLYFYADDFYNMIKRKAFRAEAPPIEGDTLYALLLSAFTASNGCHASPTSTPGSNENKIYRGVKILNSSGTGFDLKTFEGEIRTDSRWVYTDQLKRDQQLQCYLIAEQINANADAFLAWAKKHPDEISTTAASLVGGTKPPVETSKPTCGIEGLGWIVCPALGFLATVTDRAFDFLSTSFLSVDTKLLDTSTATYSAWSAMRSFANVAFVITFLIIVYSQLTSVGISNYGIKKMLPRLIVAAILVNASYIICQLAVDVSNILGYSLKGLFDGMGNYMHTNNSVGGDATGNGFGVFTITTILMAGAITLAFALSFPVLIATILALLMIILILLARKAIIILLIIVAPLAFVAYLLPNTEHLFKKWQKMFTTLLLVFPIISVLFGSATLAAGIIKSTNPTDNMTQLIAVGVAAMPLFLVPALLKGATSAAGAIGTKLNGWGDKAHGSVTSKGKTAFNNSMIGGIKKHREATQADRRNRIATGTYRGRGGVFNPRNLMSNANSALNDNGTFNTLTGGFGAQRDLAGQGQNRKDAQEAMNMFNNDDTLMKAWAIEGGSKGGPAYTNLSETQKKQYDQMRLANHHQKSTSFLAVADYMSSNGKGDLQTLRAALSSANQVGASAIEIDSATESARAAYRKSGRGDVLGQMAAHMNTTGNNKSLLGNVAASSTVQQAAMESAWAEVSAESVHREAIGYKKDASGATMKDASGNPILSDGAVAYNNYLAASPDNTRKALAGFDKMEARAQKEAQGKLIEAARAHETTATGASTISTIQDAKAFFGVV